MEVQETENDVTGPSGKISQSRLVHRLMGELFFTTKGEIK
jgi:hypothetical protein